jgi:hypothetical protein
VRDIERSRPFYRRLLHEVLGMVVQYDDPDTFYCIGGRTDVMIRNASAEHRETPKDKPLTPVRM